MDMTVGQAISISCSIIVVSMAVYYAYMEPRELIRRDHALLEENTGLYGDDNLSSEVYMVMIVGRGYW